MIKISNLNKYYGSNHILKDINMEVRAGEVFGIVGHSGAGKSTLLRCLNGLEKYDSGSLQVRGHEVGSLKTHELHIFRASMGMVFQNFNLMSRKTVAKNVAYPLNLWGCLAGIQADRVDELLEIVGLKDKRNASISSLSGGQKQRVGIARALALSPKILLCDEATSALDPKTTMSILDLLQDINERLHITIVLVTHQMEVVKRLCHRLLMLDGGVEQGMGRTEDLFLNPTGGLRKMIEDEYTLIPDGINIRLHFPRDISQKAVITSMARELGIDFSIVGGKLERYLDDVMGYLIINVPVLNIHQAVNYLNEKKLYWQIIDSTSSKDDEDIFSDADKALLSGLAEPSLSSADNSTSSSADDSISSSADNSASSNADESTQSLSDKLLISGTDKATLTELKVDSDADETAK